jgi:pimeloyl-ACP methyl ester carboxylesterase
MRKTDLNSESQELKYIQSFCPKNTEVEILRQQVNESINLKIIKFTPEKRSHKQAILFVAGWVSQISAWEAVLSELSKDYVIYYLETREKISAKVTGKAGYGVEDIGSDVAVVVEKLGLKSGEFVLVGSSLGATSILDSCLRTEIRASALILIGPNAVFRVPKIWIAIVNLFYPPLYNLLKPAVKWYLRTFRLDLKTDYDQYKKYSDALDAADPWKLKKGVLKLAKYEVWGILEKISIPALIIGASKDSLHEPENLKRMTTMLPNATYIDLETNKQTHSREMIRRMKGFLLSLFSPK